jgi:hypothetical protein
MIIFRIGQQEGQLLFRHYTDQYIQFGQMWQSSLLIAKSVRLKIADAALMLTLIPLKQPLYTE